ncbi:MAG: hypothetical protein K8R99_01355 [Actinomycetia bacterium]|nr:hypothetical protein [Actinomycetes bacterium]
MADTPTVVLVEGESDRLALEAAAIVCGVDLTRAGVEVVAIGGATNIGRFVRTYDSVRLAALCDVGERRLFARHFEQGLFVCERDLEDELIRALGVERVEKVIESEGELQSLRTLQQMPFHRDRTTSEHLHRFIGSRSGRKQRYGALLASALAADELPRPLRDLLAYVGQPSSAFRQS